MNLLCFLSPISPVPPPNKLPEVVNKFRAIRLILIRALVWLPAVPEALRRERRVEFAHFQSNKTRMSEPQLRGCGAWPLARRKESLQVYTSIFVRASFRIKMSGMKTTTKKKVLDSPQRTYWQKSLKLGFSFKAKLRTWCSLLISKLLLHSMDNYLYLYHQKSKNKTKPAPNSL